LIPTEAHLKLVLLHKAFYNQYFPIWEIHHSLPSDSREEASKSAVKSLKSDAMGSLASPPSLVEALEQICDVDVDAVDPEMAKGLPFKPHNRSLSFHGYFVFSGAKWNLTRTGLETSNQVIIANTMCESKFHDMVIYYLAYFSNIL
jgi:hypothetical protein